MTTSDAPALLHIVGYLTGASLYAMLLVMVVRAGGFAYRLTFVTALLGLSWNLGELAAHGLVAVHLPRLAVWVSVASYGALGFLAAVAVHSAGRGHDDQESLPSERGSRAVAVGAYLCAALAAAIQVFAAMTGRPLPWSMGLVVLTGGLALFAFALLVQTRRQPHGRRAVWMVALALFAVSALHLGRVHGAPESWLTELLGHHASIPLAFGILYQDFRFAFADLFLKRALTLLALVTLVFMGWSALAPSIAIAAPTSLAIGALLTLWIATAFLFPWLRQQISAFVDRIVLMRADYDALVEDLAATLRQCGSEDAVLRHVCDVLAPALSADGIAWQTGMARPAAHPQNVAILTVESPQHTLTIGRLAGGRRLLSDDLQMLERVALLAGRRIDVLRLSDERYERMLREREISALTVESELRALRAQINPHFLFNALTTLGYLIQHAPARALDTLMRLTTLLRSVLRSEGEFTTLGHERELIDCYLEIERERFEERLETSIEIPPTLADVTIPSFIVQPLVENAIKHGIATSLRGGRIVVKASLLTDGEQPCLQVIVRNTGSPLTGRAPAPGGGVGLQNVERRLRGYYGEGATLTLARGTNGETVAELRLPTSETQMHVTPIREARR